MNDERSIKAVAISAVGKVFQRVLVVTGSGISAESGIPTFRGPGGYWRNLDPTRLATATAFARDPLLVWDWYRERRALIRRSEPNAAHRAVVELATRSEAFLLLTQNVDDLHARATWERHSLPPAGIVQIHGDIFVSRCTRCDFRRAETLEDAAGVPQCPHCGARLRPAVVWFDEELGPADVHRVEAFLAGGTCDLVVVVGTTAAFAYIVEWTRRAKGRSGRSMEVNPEPSALSFLATEVIRQPAALALPRLVARGWSPAAAAES
jgi:NAD-dependent deacetylase